jgi:hypothetical protein
MEHGSVSDTARLQQLYARRVAARGTAGGAGCATPEAIVAVVQREGSEAARLATLEHVMSCAACHREYEWLKAVDQAGVEAAGGAGASARRAWWRGAPLALAASIAAIVGAAVVLSSVLRPATDRERGSGRDITLVTPGERVDGGPSVAFTWRALPEPSRYVLEVQRADGSVVLADTTRDTVAVVGRERLAGGTAYRWWVREVTDGAEPRSSAFRALRVAGDSR